MSDRYNEDLERKIRQRAFQIWVEEGQPSGRDRQHWIQAKAEVMACSPAGPHETSELTDQGKTPGAGTLPSADQGGTTG